MVCTRSILFGLPVRHPEGSAALAMQPFRCLGDSKLFACDSGSNFEQDQKSPNFTQKSKSPGKLLNEATMLSGFAF